MPLLTLATAKMFADAVKPTDDADARTDGPTAFAWACFGIGFLILCVGAFVVLGTAAYAVFHQH